MIKLLLFILLLPTLVFAKEQPLGPNMLYLNNQTTVPFTFNLTSNSTTNVLFHLYGTGNYDNLYDPGSYLYFTIVTNGPIEIKRKNNVGVNCSSSCFANDTYLQLIDDQNGYQYLFYFKISKINWSYGTQTWQYYVDDEFSIINKINTTNPIFIFGGYMEDVNPVPNLISNAKIQESIDIMGERYEQGTNDIIDSNKVCTYVDKNSIVFNGNYLANNGSVGNYSDFGITDYYKINKDTEIIPLQIISNTGNYCYYTEKKILISCYQNNTLTTNNLSIPSNAQYIRFTISKANNKPQFNICKNGNQANNDAINDINNNITNPNIDNPNGDFGDMEDLIASNGVITNLISLPITLYSSILNNVNSSCSSFNLGTLYNHNITFQCINLGNLLGSSIWGVIDMLFSGFTIYAISKKMIKVFHNLSGLQEGDVIDD